MARDPLRIYAAEATNELASLQAKGPVTLESGLGAKSGALLVTLTTGDRPLSLGDRGIGTMSSCERPVPISASDFRVLETSASDPALPALSLFVTRLLRMKTLYDQPCKTLSFLDGGNDKGGVVEAFRKKRAEVLRARFPGRTPSSISGSAFVDGRYFKRQLYLPLILGCMEDIGAIQDIWLHRFDPETVAKIQDCRLVLLKGGIVELQRRIEQASENESEQVKLRVVQEKRLEMGATAGGQPLNGAVRKKIRDAGSSCKSNEKRKRSCEHTRRELEDKLELRASVFTKMKDFFHSCMPILNPDDSVLVALNA